MEILKHKFKKGIIKCYDREKRFDCEYVQKIVDEVASNKNIDYFYSFMDMDSHLGFHCNCIFKSKSYRALRTLYTDKGPKKDKRLYFWMHDINSTDQFIQFVTYCNMRNELNFRRALPHAPPTVDELMKLESEDSPGESSEHTPPSSPEPDNMTSQTVVF